MFEIAASHVSTKGCVMHQNSGKNKSPLDRTPCTLSTRQRLHIGVSRKSSMHRKQLFSQPSHVGLFSIFCQRSIVIRRTSGSAYRPLASPQSLTRLPISTSTRTNTQPCHSDSLLWPTWRSITVSGGGWLPQNRIVHHCHFCSRSHFVFSCFCHRIARSTV